MPVSTAGLLYGDTSNESASVSKGLVRGVFVDEPGRDEKSEAGVEYRDWLELDQGESCVLLDGLGDGCSCMWLMYEVGIRSGER